MFAELGLPVCDDDVRIRQEIEKQRPRRLREMNNPSPDIRQRAKDWSQHALWLTDRRSELLEVVYKQFEQVATLGVQLASAQTVLILTPEVHQSLCNLARESCKLDDAMTRRFIDRYKTDHNVRAGGAIISVEPASIDDFTATCTGKSIILRWKRPLDRCDKVLIFRSDKFAVSGGDSHATETPIAETTGDFYEDHAARPGKWYEYRACALYRTTKGVQRPFFIAYPGEVEDANAVLENGKVTLTWKRPAQRTTVWVFRRESANPEFRVEDEIPVPTGSHTVQLSCGDMEWIEDQNLREGATYHYLIISDFEQGRITKGVVRQIHVPQPPPAPASVKAAYAHAKDTDEVRIKWEPARTNLPVSYKLVRREGSAAPDRPDDNKSQVIEESTHSTSINDKSVVSGKRYTYAVFTRAGEIYSRTGTASNPVDILTDVTGVQPTAGNQTVELRWNVPKNISEVRVRRSVEGYPKSVLDGTVVAVIGTTAVKDCGLVNGRRYHYRIFCVYRPEANAEVVSEGVSISAIPEDLPDPGTRLDFKVQAIGSAVKCSWNPPLRGNVLIRRFSAPHGFACGQIFDAVKLDIMGEGVAGAGPDTAIDADPTIKSPFYGIFIVSGSNARAGEIKLCVVVPDVRNLKINRTMTGFVLAWSWPQDCDMVTVVRRFDTWPQGHNDPQATAILFSRKDYKDAGARFVDAITTKEPWIHYTVYARATAGGHFHHAPGSTKDCRAKAHAGSWTKLSYQIICPTKRPYAGSHILLKWTLDDPMPGFAGFVFVADKDKVPSGPYRGLTIFRTSPDQAAAGSGEAWVPLETIQREQWGHFFCKAFVSDPLQQASTIIIHPNTCVCLTEKGRMEAISVNHHGQTYRAGTPRTIVCPFDFQEFPIEDIQYRHRDKTDAIKANYTAWERLWGRIRGRKRKVKVAKDASGLIYPQKFCPQGHLLPINADRQESLTIGLIGAKYSGKTHYVGALVNRLFSRTAEDLNIGLTGVTDDTNKRYEREFRRPFIENHNELPMTVGSPPPLIYSVRCNLPDKNQFQSVNLALYETAGENLEDPETAREMVKYLSVAAGVMLLVDPLQIETVRQSLPASFRKPALDPNATPCGIINNINSILETHKVDGVLSIPVAVVMTKCDELRETGLIEPNRLWCMEDKRHRDYFHREWHEDMSGMMGEYLQHWDLAAYSAAVKQYPRHAFFGVSATGCASEGGRFKFVSPWRVEDPLVWLLTELGVLPPKPGHDA